MDLKFPKLTAVDIECRVGTIKEKGCSLLLYKDARCDIRILDETVGALNWKREHFEAFKYLFCRVSIYDEQKEQWTWKEDTGTPSQTEPEKGHASDSFKRACFNWGIGIELYTAPFIWIKLDKNEVATNAKGKFQLTSGTKFFVKEIKYENNRIANLIISDKAGNKRYSYINGKTTDTLPEEEAPEEKVTEAQKKQWQETANDDINLIKQVLKENHYNNSKEVPAKEFETINDLIRLRVQTHVDLTAQLA